MSLPGRFAMLVVLTGGTACGAETEPAQYTASFRHLGTLQDDPAPGAPPLLQMPSYLRSAPEPGVFWTLDTGRKAAVRLDARRAHAPSGTAGSPGRGPGELRIALGMDVSPAGRVWVGDPGNGKVVGYENGRVVAEFMVGHQPLGIAVPGENAVWVGGDLMESLMVRYDTTGLKQGTAGRPVVGGREAFLRNQGVAARGAGPCAVVWAYTYHSRVDCFADDGSTVWSVAGPVDVAPDRRADPMRMSPDDVFAYTDVMASDGRVYALFLGRKGDGLGRRSRTVHVFTADEGRFLGAMRLPVEATYLALRDSVLAMMEQHPTPRIHLYAFHDR